MYLILLWASVAHSRSASGRSGVSHCMDSSLYVAYEFESSILLEFYSRKDVCALSIDNIPSIGVFARVLLSPSSTDSDLLGVIVHYTHLEQTSSSSLLCLRWAQSFCSGVENPIY